MKISLFAISIIAGFFSCNHECSIKINQHSVNLVQLKLSTCSYFRQRPIALNNNCAKHITFSLHPRPKMIWPAARHTSVNIFSNRAEFYWPPSCNHLIKPSWQMESCTHTSPEEKWSCRRDSLRGSRSASRYNLKSPFRSRKG